jgi:hypothetical protein
MKKNKNNYYDPIVEGDYTVMFDIVLPMGDGNLITTGKIKMVVHAGSQGDANAKAYFFICRKFRVVIVDGSAASDPNINYGTAEAEYQAYPATPKPPQPSQVKNETLYDRVNKMWHNVFNENFWK